MGSTRAARRAGIQLASNATLPRTSGTATKVGRSSGATPNSWVRSRCAVDDAITRPATVATATARMPRPSSSRTHHARPHVRRPGDLDAVSDRRLSRPGLAGRLAAYDHDPFRCGDVGRGELAAFDQRDAHGPQRAIADHVLLGLRRLRQALP